MQIPQASCTPVNVLQMHNIKLGKENDEKVGRYLQSSGDTKNDF